MRNEHRFSYLVIVSLLLTALCAGCGSDNRESTGNAGNEGAFVSALTGNVPEVGDTECFQCHSQTADPLNPLPGSTVTQEYQRSVHAEIGCESCHGGGAQHHGIGPFPFQLNASVTDAQIAARCDDCHNTGTTEYKGKIAPLSSSPNFQNGNHANPFGAEEAHEPKCARCHSHEGAILYNAAGFTGDNSVINNTALQPVLPRDPETFSTMRCATCHEHGGNQRQILTRDTTTNAVVAWDPNRNFLSDQIDLCTGCHVLNNNANTKIAATGRVIAVETYPGSATFRNVSTVGWYHSTAWYRTLATTHRDQAFSSVAPSSVTPAPGSVIEGYVMRTVAQVKNPCFDCHGHEFQTNTRRLDPAASASVLSRPNTRFLDWGRSGHAGGILRQKVAAAASQANRTNEQVEAVIRAGVTDETGPAWTHYNWDDTASRGACQRCHTSTGASNFMTNPAAYDATGAGNSFVHLQGWTNASKTSGQNELLYCWGCHQNSGTGLLYTPGARTESYTPAATGDAPAVISYPDIAGSNVCMTCHVGREVGQTIKNNNDADGVRAFVNSHYLTAGANLFAAGGYTYEGRDYSNPSFFQHDKVGTSAAPGTGSNGPCVGCHMSSPNKHLFTNVSSNSAGEITKITSTVCVVCHTGNFAITAASLQTEEEEYQAALQGLDAALASKGIFFSSGNNPYFFTAPFVTGGTNTNYTNWAGPYGVAAYKDTMGAAFNLNMLVHDPGGFAHNRFYAKRLIWDSIDFIDNGVLDNSTPATLAAVLTGTTLTEAQTYLGSSRP